MTEWRVITEARGVVVRVASAPSATLVSLPPRALAASPAVALRAAIRELAPHVAFGPPMCRAGSRYVVARVHGEHLEVGLVTDHLVSVPYLLATRPDHRADPEAILRVELASTTSPFAHWAS